MYGREEQWRAGTDTKARARRRTIKRNSGGGGLGEWAAETEISGTEGWV